MFTESWSTGYAETWLKNRSKCPVGTLGAPSLFTERKMMRLYSAMISDLHLRSWNGKLLWDHSKNRMPDRLIFFKRYLEQHENLELTVFHEIILFHRMKKIRAYQSALVAKIRDLVQWRRSWTSSLIKKTIFSHRNGTNRTQFLSLRAVENMKHLENEFQVKFKYNHIATKCQT